jgi:hypothetical protein
MLSFGKRIKITKINIEKTIEKTRLFFPGLKYVHR